MLYRLRIQFLFCFIDSAKTKSKLNKWVSSRVTNEIKLLALNKCIADICRNNCEQTLVVRLSSNTEKRHETNETEKAHARPKNIVS